MKLFKRRSLDERLTRVLVRAMEREFPQPWTSLSEARREPPRHLAITSWNVSRFSGLGGPELTITISARGWL